MTAQKRLSAINFYKRSIAECIVILCHTLNIIKTTLHILKALTDLQSAV